MRKVLNILTCFAAIGLCAPNASAMKLTFEDSLWTGWFDPCASGVAAAKLVCIDGLMTLAPKGAALAGLPSPTTPTGVFAGSIDANAGTAHNARGFADLLARVLWPDRACVAERGPGGDDDNSRERDDSSECRSRPTTDAV